MGQEGCQGGCQPCLNQRAPSSTSDAGPDPAPDPHGAACGREAVGKAGSISVSCKTSPVGDTPSGAVSAWCVQQDLGTMSHRGVSPVCSKIWELCHTGGVSPVSWMFLTPDEHDCVSHHLQGPALKITGYRAKPRGAQPHIPPVCPTTITHPGVGTRGCLAMGSLLCPAHAAPAPALPSSPQVWCVG